jgi:CRP-like cAMP-binding protein
MANLAYSPDILARMDLFRGLPPAALAEAMARGRIRRLARDTVIFTQGEAASRAHALIEGRVRIAQSDEGGGHLLIRFIGPGDMFGTVALFTTRRYPAEAEAVTDSVEIAWTEATLLDLLGRYPQIALNVVKIVGARLQEVQERLRELATQRVEQRLARALLRLAEQAGQTADGGTTIAFPLSRKDLAEMCGTTLHTASRILTAWEKTGLAASGRRRITLRSLSGLKTIAEGWA